MPGKNPIDGKVGMLVCAMAFAALSAMPAVGRAQAFFNPTPTAYSPVIDTVSSGVINDLQATVSADRKYVTINAQPQNSQLLALHTFSFGGNGPATQPATGGGARGTAIHNPVFIGNIRFLPRVAEVDPKNPNRTVIPNEQTPVINPPMAFDGSNGAKVLEQPGMTRITKK